MSTLEKGNAQYNGATIECAHFNITQNNTTFRLNGVFGSGSEIDGDYAWQMVAKSSSPSTVKVQIGGQQFEFAVMTEFQKFTHVFEGVRVTATPYVDIVFQTGDFWLYHTQLEHGNVVTDWHPHIDDNYDKSVDMFDNAVQLIESTATSIRQTQQDIILRAEKIISDEDLSNIESTMYANLKLYADGIKMEVEDTISGDGTPGSGYLSRSEFEQTAQGFLTTATTQTNGNTLVSIINQSSDKIKMQALNIDLSGYVTFTNLSTAGQTTINGGNITTGTLTADNIGAGTLSSNVIYSGSISADQINTGTLWSRAIINKDEDNNIVFSVSPQGSVVAKDISITGGSVVLSGRGSSENNAPNYINLSYTIDTTHQFDYDKLYSAFVSATRIQSTCNSKSITQDYDKYIQLSGDCLTAGYTRKEHQTGQINGACYQTFDSGGIQITDASQNNILYAKTTPHTNAGTSIVFGYASSSEYGHGHSKFLGRAYFAGADTIYVDASTTLAQYISTAMNNSSGGQDNNFTDAYKSYLTALASTSSTSGVSRINLGSSDTIYVGQSTLTSILSGKMNSSGSSGTVTFSGATTLSGSVNYGYKSSNNVVRSSGSVIDISSSIISDLNSVNGVSISSVQNSIKSYAYYYTMGNMCYVTFYLYFQEVPSDGVACNITIDSSGTSYKNFPIPIKIFDASAGSYGNYGMFNAPLGVKNGTSTISNGFVGIYQQSTSKAVMQFRISAYAGAYAGTLMYPFI